MYGQIARILGAVLLGAVVASSLGISRYLSLLEGGIRRDIDAIDRIVAVEKEIQRQNDVLTDMVTTTKRIGTGLDGVLATSERIHGSVVSVGASNRSTLQLNGKLEADNAAAARELSRVVAALKGMNQSSAAIDQYLSSLSEVVDGELDALRAIAANTARMNLKTPEVNLP
ncbi:MAG TPA: hypothetical protein VNT75_26245 [Symbiobacteriaceae bacterium]|nr:hypothetical protein [Symbiobacteriaceae bacterium]